MVLCGTSPEGKYTLAASDPIPIVRDKDQIHEQLINMQCVLIIIEDRIKSNPVLWSMFYPVWPDVITLTS